MRYLKQFAVIFALVTITIAITNAMVVPPKAEAYYSNDYNFRFKGDSNLSNGYSVKINGVGFMRYSGLYVFTSANVGVDIIKTVKNTKSKFLGVKLIHNTSAYGINKLDITAPFTYMSKDLVSTCRTMTCNLQSSHSIKGIYLNPVVSLRAELTFDTGTFTVWTTQEKRQQ